MIQSILLYPCNSSYSVEDYRYVYAGNMIGVSLVMMMVYNCWKSKYSHALANASAYAILKCAAFYLPFRKIEHSIPETEQNIHRLAQEVESLSDYATQYTNQIDQYKDVVRQVHEDAIQLNLYADTLEDCNQREEAIHRDQEGSVNCLGEDTSLFRSAAAILRTDVTFKHTTSERNDALTQSTEDLALDARIQRLKSQYKMMMKS